VLLCIARDPGVRLRDIADRLRITERSAHGIVADLAEAATWQGPNVRLLRSAGCSLSVTADVRAKGSPADVPDNRPLSGIAPGGIG
jgi:hypothetical protein